MRAVLAAVLVAVAVAAPLSSWEQFKSDFGKEYATGAEEASRYQIFFENLRVIEAHNAGNSSFTMGITQFADLTAAEFSAYVKRFPMNVTRPRNEVWITEAPLQEVDWRQKNAVTEIKNQGQCGSCWSFSTTGSVEGAHAIATGKLVSLSEQQLMDCSTRYGNHGCNGGLMDYAFEYVIANGGLDTEEDYPYTAEDGKCNTEKEKKHAAEIHGFRNVPKEHEDQLAAAVSIGPVSVAIEADQAGFQHYTSGVFDGKCGTSLDHGVLVVGYSDDYWIVKNSWGKSWGEEGYIRLKRGVDKKGMCGITMQASYPEVKKSVVAPAASNDYEDPNPNGCNSGEQAIQITGVSGSFCSPSCSTSSACPTNVPSGTTARPECVLEMPGSSSPTRCALICDPSSGGCPSGATCQSISGTGVCTYAN